MSVGSDNGWSAGGPATSVVSRVALGVAASLGIAVSYLALSLFLPVASPSQAATTHDLAKSVAEAPPGTHLAEPGASVFDRASGELFMADPGAGAVDVFSSTGSFLTQLGEGGLEPTGVAVDESTGNVYVASGSALVVFKPNGKGGYQLLSEWEGANAPAKVFGSVAGVAFDNSKGALGGDVVVIDGANGAADVIKPKPAGPEESSEGSFVQLLKGTKLEEPNAAAVDASSGRIYVADSPKGFVAAYGPSGTFETKIGGASSPEGPFLGPEGEEGNVRAIAAEEGELYVAEAERRVVSQFNSAGVWQGWVTKAGAAPLQEPSGVTVAPAGDLFIADALSGQLDLLGPGVIVPDTKTEKASKVGKTTAIFNGTVDGDGKAAKYRFAYGPTEAYGSETPLTSTAGTGEEKVRAEVQNLAPGSAYHFRLIAENENGANEGADRELETLPAVEGLQTGPVSGIKPSEATLTGSLTPNGTDAHYDFELGASASYGEKTPSVDAGSAKEAVAAKALLTTLTPNTTYHYRLTATNSFGTTEGADAHFTTSGPPQILPQPTTGLTHEAATINAKLDPGELETTYHFVYGESTAYGHETSPAKLAPGEAFVPVAATLSSLKIGTTYHYRLIAENSAGKTEEPDQSFETVPPALLEGTSATEVSSSSATFAAQIDPLGHDTTYYFQYGAAPCKPNPAACTDVPAAPGTDIGSGEIPVPVSQKATELKPQTTYYYRALAINSLGTSEGPERILTTQLGGAAFALVDNRAWEMVTPPNKGGAVVEALTREGGLILAAENGERLTYVVNGALGEPEGNRSPEMQQVLATRGVTAWTSEDIATPNSKAKGVSLGQAPEYQYFTPDLSLALDEPWGSGEPAPPLAPGVRQGTPYLRDNATGRFTPIVTESNTASGTTFGGSVHFVSAAPDLRHIVLKSSVALTGAGSAAGLYEWNEGALTFLSELPGGTPASEPELGLQGRVVQNAVSTDGSRIIWTNREDLSTRGGHLYMRDTAHDRTIQLDAAQGVAEPNKGSALFQAADPKDSRVFFTDRQRLTPGATAEPGSGSGKPDLYECEIVESEGGLACRLTDLTVDSVEGEHAAVQGLLLGADESASTLYFVANGVLATNENANREVAESSKDNLYMLHESSGNWTTTFIARLSSEDGPEWEGNGLDDPAFVTAGSSRNGRYFAFMSAASPTGYDNIDANPAAHGAHDEEVYLYDTASESLTCISCNPSGARPAGRLDQSESGEGLGLLIDRRKVWGESGHEHWLGGNIPGWTALSLTEAPVQPRYLSNEGRLFFNSPDQLVPAATNHEANVYEYEPSGVGTCRSTSYGCVALLSSGTSDRESAFVEATPSGNDVFFVTQSNLVPQDKETAFAIYDARVCTSGSPCQTPPTPAPPGCSEANACRPTEPPQQAPLSPSGSATVRGGGNLPPQPPVKGGSLGSKTTNKPKPTRAQELAKALKACKKLKKRLKCEAQARKRWGSKPRPKPKKPAKHVARGGRRGWR